MPGVTTIVVVLCPKMVLSISIVWVPGVSGFKRVTQPCAADRPVVPAGSPKRLSGGRTRSGMVVSTGVTFTDWPSTVIVGASSSFISRAHRSKSSAVVPSQPGGGSSSCRPQSLSNVLHSNEDPTTNILVPGFTVHSSGRVGVGDGAKLRNCALAEVPASGKVVADEGVLGSRCLDYRGPQRREVASQFARRVVGCVSRCRCNLREHDAKNRGHDNQGTCNKALHKIPQNRMKEPRTPQPGWIVAQRCSTQRPQAIATSARLGSKPQDAITSHKDAIICLNHPHWPMRGPTVGSAWLPFSAGTRYAKCRFPGIASLSPIDQMGGGRTATTHGDASPTKLLAHRRPGNARLGTDLAQSPTLAMTGRLHP